MMKQRATMCFAGSCPAVFENDDGDLVVIGKRPSEAMLAELEDRMGEDELAVVIPAELLEQFLNSATEE